MVVFGAGRAGVLRAGVSRHGPGEGGEVTLLEGGQGGEGGEGGDVSA